MKELDKNLIQISDRVHDLHMLTVAITEFEDGNPASFRYYAGFEVAQSLVQILDNGLFALREEAEKLNPFPFDVISAACGASSALVLAADEVEDDQLRVEDFFSLAYVTERTMQALSTALFDLIYE